jgi:hypothetical protein
MLRGVDDAVAEDSGFLHEVHVVNQISVSSEI